MKLLWDGDSWNEYLVWRESREVSERINDLIKDIGRNGHRGLGKPEPLKHEYSGWWSRRINREHRLIYRLDDGMIIILKCKGHYKL